MRVARLQRSAAVGMRPLLASYVALLTVHGDGFEPLVDGWLGVLTQYTPAVVCGLAWATAGPRRLEVGLLAVGIAAFASGNVVLVLAEARHELLLAPSAADIGYLGFYPIVLCVLLVAAHRELRRSSTP